MRKLAIVLGLVVGWIVARRLRRLSPEQRVGTFLGVPYDLRWPTFAVLRERFWNPQDRRLLTPHVLGWGWSVNLYELGRRLGCVRCAVS